MNEDVRTIYLFKLSKNNTGSYSKVYNICCKAVASLNELGIRNRRSKKPFKHPRREAWTGRSIGRKYILNGKLHKKLSNMIKETYIP
jgi:hypothetical protein